MRKINNIVIHCTATPQTTTVESVQAYWKNELGWESPGYHHIIKANGEQVHLLPIEHVSNGVRGHNSDSIHISYIGGVDASGNTKDTRTPSQISTMKLLILKYHRMFPSAEIKGHRDFSPDKNGNGYVDPFERIKDCPSFDVREWILNEALTK